MWYFLRLKHLLNTKMFKLFIYLFFYNFIFSHVLSCQMSQWYKQVHDGPGCVCRKGRHISAEALVNKGGLNGKPKERPSWVHECQFSLTACSPPALSLHFTMQAALNTSSPEASSRTLALPLMNEPLSGPFFQPSFVSTARHYRFGQSKQDSKREKDYRSHVKPYFTVYVSRQHLSLQHIQANISTWTYKHAHTHTLLFFTITPHAHTVLIAPCEGHKGPLITGMGSFKSGRRTQCCSCRMERN